MNSDKSFSDKSNSDKLNSQINELFDDTNGELIKLIVTNGQQLLKLVFDKALHTGNTELVKFIIQQDTLNWNMCIQDVCETGHYDIAKLLLNKGTSCLHTGLKTACINGDIDMADVLTKYGTTNLNEYVDEYMCVACKHGHTKTVELMIKYGATNWNEGFKSMCNHGLSKNSLGAYSRDTNDVKIAKLMIEHNTDINYNEYMFDACIYGRTNIVKLMIEYGADNWNDGLYYACKCGGDSGVEIIKLMVQHGANDWNKGLRGSQKGNSVKTAELMIQYGANNFEEILEACGTICRTKGYQDNIKIAELMIQYTDRLDKGLTAACKGNNVELLKLMIQCGATNFDEGLIAVCGNTNTNNDDILEMVRCLLNCGVTNINEKLLIACKHGCNVQILKLLIDNGATNINDCMLEVCRGLEKGALGMINLLINHGATNLNECMNVVCGEGGKGDAFGSGGIIVTLIQHGANNLVDALMIACEYGNIQTVKLLIRYASSYSNINKGLAVACEYGHVDIVEYFIMSEADNWNKALQAACYGGHVGLVRRIFECDKYKSVNINEGFLNACQSGNLETIKFMIDKKATNTDRGLEMACKGGNLELVEFMLTEGYLKKDKSNSDNSDNSDNNWENGLLDSCYYGHTKVAELMITKGATNLKEGLRYTCTGMQQNIQYVNLLDLERTERAEKTKRRFPIFTISGHLETACMLITKSDQID